MCVVYAKFLRGMIINIIDDCCFTSCLLINGRKPHSFDLCFVIRHAFQIQNNKIVWGYDVFSKFEKNKKITKKNNENRRKISNMRGRNFTKIGSYVESVTKSFLFNGRSQKMKRKELWR